MGAPRTGTQSGRQLFDGERPGERTGSRTLPSVFQERTESSARSALKHRPAAFAAPPAGRDNRAPRGRSPPRRRRAALGSEKLGPSSGFRQGWATPPTVLALEIVRR